MSTTELSMGRKVAITATVFIFLMLLVAQTFAQTPQAMINGLRNTAVSLGEINDYLAQPDLTDEDEQQTYTHLKSYFDQYGFDFIGIKRSNRNDPDKQFSITQIIDAKPAKLEKKILKKNDADPDSSVVAIPPVKVSVTEPPFDNSGKLVMYQGEFIIYCTAHLIAPGYLLTAAHCFGGNYDISQLSWYQAYDQGFYTNEVKPVWIAHNKNYDQVIRNAGKHGHASEKDKQQAIDAGFDYVLLGIPRASTQTTGNPIACLDHKRSSWNTLKGIQIGYGEDYGNNNELYATEVTVKDILEDPDDPLSKKRNAWMTLYDGVGLGEGSSGGPFLFPAKEGRGMVVSGSLTGTLSYEDGSAFLFGPTFLAHSNFSRFIKAHNIPYVGCDR